MALAICKTVYYNGSANRTEALLLQRLIMPGFGATKGNGVKIPAFNQYRGHRDSYPLAKASHWGNLRRQGRGSSEMRVGRTTVIDRIFAKNGYGDVLPIF